MQKGFALIFKYAQRLFWFSTVGNQILTGQMPRKMKMKLQIYANNHMLYVQGIYKFSCCFAGSPSVHSIAGVRARD